jgi:hypothetical protein
MLLRQRPTRRVLSCPTAKLLRDEAESMVPNIDPAQVRKLAGWGLTENDRDSSVGWSPPSFGCWSSPASAGVLHSFYPLRRQIMQNPVEQGHETRSNPLLPQDLWPSERRSSVTVSARFCAAGGRNALENPDLLCDLAQSKVVKFANYWTDDTQQYPSRLLSDWRDHPCQPEPTS